MKKFIGILIAFLLFTGLAFGQDTWVDGKQVWSTPIVSTPTITGGTINNTIIGGTTAAAGTFTTLTGTTVAGGMIATDGETLTGTAVDHLVTPANLTARLASPGAIGGTAQSTVAYKNSIIDGSTAIVLTAAQVSNTVISNTGQGVADVNHTLPTAAAGYHFRAAVGEAQAANYFRFTRSGSDEVILDGTGSKTYVQIAAPTRGALLNVYTLQVASTGIKTGAALAIGTTNTDVASGAFTFDVAGTGYAKAAVAAGTAPGNDVVPQNKYGAVAFDIGADGTIDVIEAAGNAVGYDSAVLAVAGLAAAGAGHVRIGYVTAMKSDGDFTFGTTALDAANTTIAYTSTAAYTKPYAWVCNAITGTWATD